MQFVEDHVGRPENSRSPWALAINSDTCSGVVSRMSGGSVRCGPAWIAALVAGRGLRSGTGRPISSDGGRARLAVSIRRRAFPKTATHKSVCSDRAPAEPGSACARREIGEARQETRQRLAGGRWARISSIERPAWVSAKQFQAGAPRGRQLAAGEPAEEGLGQLECRIVRCGVADTAFTAWSMSSGSPAASPSSLVMLSGRSRLSLRATTAGSFSPRP